MLKQNKVKLEYGERNAAGWTSGKAYCGKRIYDFIIKHYDKPSDYGIDQGRISKLWLREVGESNSLLNYDRGWDMGYTPDTPRKNNGDVRAIYIELLKKFN